MIRTTQVVPIHELREKRSLDRDCIRLLLEHPTHVQSLVEITLAGRTIPEMVDDSTVEECSSLRAVLESVSCRAVR